MTYNLKNSPINKGAAANPSPMRSIGLIARMIKVFSHAGVKSYKKIRQGYESYKKGKNVAKKNKAIDKLLTDKNISKVDFERKLAKTTKTVVP